MQLMPEADAAGYRINPFDLTKVWPHGDYPLIEVGRLELNRTQLPVNSPKGCPFDGGRNYGRDGFMRFGGNGGRSVNYEPNSFSGPTQTGEALYKGFDLGDVSGAYGPEVRAVDDYQQAGDLYRLMGPEEQQRLVDAIAGSLAQVQRSEIGDAIVARSIDHFRKADATYGSRVEEAAAAARI